MSLEDLAYLAEIVGVILIIASLIYVGKQLQQNTLQMRVDASRDRLNIFMQFWFRVSDDPEFAALWSRGGPEFSELNDIDKLRLESFETAGLMVWSYYYELHKQKLLPDNQWKEQLGDIEAVGKRESMRTAWQKNKYRFSESFQKFLTKYLE